MKKLVVMAVLALVAGLMTLGGGGQASADPGTLFVAPTGSGGGFCATPDHNTIQDAIDAASAGDTINVCPGTYNEDLSIPTDDLELAGLSSSPGPTIEGIATVPAASFPLADPNIDIKANGVSIHGFTIKSPVVSATEYSSGIVLTGTDIEIYDNEFLVGTGDVSQGIQTWHTTNAPSGLRDITGLHIHDNEFSHLAAPTGVECYEGVYINPQDDAFDPTDAANAITIENNTFSGNLIRAITTERATTVIDGNSLSTDCGLLGSFPRGIQLSAATLGAQASTNHSVTDNTIDDSGSGVFVTGILLKDGVTDSVIGGSGNTVTGASGNGIEVNGDDNTVSDNTSNHNGEDGIRVDGNDNQISGNTTNHNADDGIHETGERNPVSNNGANHNLDHGLVINGFDKIVSGNEAGHNGHDGIYLHTWTSGNELSNNNAHHNDEDGIHDAADPGDNDVPTTGAGKNKAKFNGVLNFYLP